MDVLLGSGGWIPTPTRATACVLTTDGAQALVLDAGTGIAALVRDPALLDGIDHLAVALTHFHLDHVVGLTYLPALLPAVTIEVWGPGQLLSGVASHDVLRSLVGPPFLSAPLDSFVRSVHELAPGGNEIGGRRLDVRVQERHPGGSVALRVDDEVAYCTDTAPDPGNAHFVQDVQVLVHEAWSPASASDEHSSALSAAHTASDGRVDELVLTHIHPQGDDPASLLEPAKAAFPRARIGHDLLRLR